MFFSNFLLYDLKNSDMHLDVPSPPPPPAKKGQFLTKLARRQSLRCLKLQTETWSTELPPFFLFFAKKVFKKINMTIKKFMDAVAVGGIHCLIIISQEVGTDLKLTS